VEEGVGVGVASVTVRLGKCSCWDMQVEKWSKMKHQPEESASLHDENRARLLGDHHVHMDSALVPSTFPVGSNE
jgi:hypothetical protein